MPLYAFAIIHNIKNGVGMTHEDTFLMVEFMMS